MVRRWLLIALVATVACKRVVQVTVMKVSPKPTPLFSAVIVPAASPPPPVETAPPSVFVTPIPTTAAMTGASQLNVEIHADGGVVVDGRAARDDEEVADRARHVASSTPDVRAIIRADKDVAYGRVVAVMDALKRAGVSKIAFVVAAPAGSP